ncbi:MAG: cytochrome c oxidase subunit II [Anaerolineae bacterium]|jgi:cytochrome c oxidase subunit 2
MKVEFYEKVFIALSLVMLAAFAVFLFISVQQHGITLVGPTQRVDPATMLSEPPFDDPGVVETSDGQYLATMIARMWFFTPEVITVPVGSTVTFQVASPDVIHGVKILDTDVNVMVIPGQVSTSKHTFDEVGEYLIVCHEYCGTGHQGMSGKVVVIGADEVDDGAGEGADEGSPDALLPGGEEIAVPEAWRSTEGGRS